MTINKASQLIQRPYFIQLVVDDFVDWKTAKKDTKTKK